MHIAFVREHGRADVTSAGLCYVRQAEKSRVHFAIFFRIAVKREVKTSDIYRQVTMYSSVA